MPSLLKVLGLADGSGTPFAIPLWVESYDVDAEPPRDRRSRLTPDGAIIAGAFGGRIVLTGIRDNARKFADAGEALTAWKTQSQKRPKRPDGRPNRPLTALTVEIEPCL